MSIYNAGDFPTSATVYIPINTFDSNDPAASVTATNLINTDVHIHKDGGTTQRNNAAGITMSIDFDSITGNHLLAIDTSDNTVADFYQAGHEYQVRVEGVTVDGGTINAWVGTFSIERSGGALALIKSATYGLSALKTLLDTTGIKVASFANNAITANAINADAITEAKIADNAIAAEHIANGAIDNATFAADVGSTSYATNIIALAVRKVLDELNLNHLMKDAVANNADLSAEVPDGTVLANMLSKTDADTSDYNPTTDSLEAIRDKLPTNLEDMSITDTTGLVDITQTAADKAWGTATRVLTAATNLGGVEVDLTKIHGTALTETAGQLAAGFVKVFDVATPVFTAESVNQTGDAFAGLSDGSVTLDSGYDAAKTAAQAGDEMDLVDAPNATALTAVATALGAKTGSITSLAYELLLERIYEMVNNKMNVTDATGAVALRNLADGADIATGSVTDDLTTTVREGLTWA